MEEASTFTEDTDAEWQRQLRDVEENEKWERRFSLIPIDLQELYRAALARYTLQQRISVYKMLDKFQWAHGRCFDMLKLLDKIPPDKVDDMAAVLQFLHGSRPGYLDAGLELMSQLNPMAFMELLYGLSEDELLYVIEIRKHLDEEDRKAMVDIVIHQLSFREMLRAIEECNEPMAKHCRLCRVRRMEALEFRMLNDGQMPEGMPKVPGIIPLVEKADIWTAEDERGFTFDVDRGLVFWKKEPVDLVKICTKCLLGLNEQAASDGRFTDLYNLTPAERKIALQGVREKQNAIGRLFHSIANERLYRRAREFALRALAALRQGRRLEKETDEREAAMERRRQEVAAAKQSKSELLAAAMSVDKKWMRHERSTIKPCLENRVVIADIGHHIGFGKEFHAPADREHPYSWRPAPFDSRGTPMTVDAASKRFGGGDLRVENHFYELQEWKQQTIAREAEVERLRKEAERLRREEEQRLYNERINFVVDKLQRWRRRKRRQQNELELAEELRLEQRAKDREQRRRDRLARMEEKERRRMYGQDMLSIEARRLARERELERIERETLCSEERLQCKEGDTFWGIDAAERRRLELEALRLKLYLQRVEEMRVELVKAMVVRPDPEEAKLKLYIDSVTGEAMR